MYIDPKLAVLQVNDALFPIGAYAHSFGLETYVQTGIISTAEDVYTYMENYIREVFLYNDLLSVSLVYNFSQQKNLNKIIEIESIYFASKSCKEIKEAVSKMGLRFIKNIKDLNNTELVNSYIEYTKFHIHSIVYALWCEEIGTNKDSTLENYLYSQIAGLVISAVKLIPLKQSEGQDILFKLQSIMRAAINKVQIIDEDAFGRNYAGYDVASMKHEALYSRLYMS